MKPVDLTGKRFGKLRALAIIVGEKSGGHRKWLCACDCGKTTAVASNNLQSDRNFHTCGCEYGRFKHGHAREDKLSPEYLSYHHAKKRCTNPNDKNWEHYGGRGIKFLFENFQQFYAELGPRPKDLTLDRINNDGNYEIGNVRWATQKQQVANQRLQWSKCDGTRPAYGGKFTASIGRNGKRVHLGTFSTAEAAMAAYRKAKQESVRMRKQALA